MDLGKYVKDAIRTESKIESVNLNLYDFDQLVLMFVSVSELLDQIKKNVFYDRPINERKWDDCIKTIDICLQILKQINHDPSSYGDTRDLKTKFNPRVFHGIVGIATEAGELVEALNASQNTIDTTNVLEEIGDLNWYSAILIDELKGDFEKVLTANIEKLKARFPEKFSNEHAINRNVEIERKVLEQNT